MIKWHALLMKWSVLASNSHLIVFADWVIELNGKPPLSRCKKLKCFLDARWRNDVSTVLSRYYPVDSLNYRNLIASTIKVESDLRIWTTGLGGVKFYL